MRDVRRESKFDGRKSENEVNKKVSKNKSYTESNAKIFYDIVVVTCLGTTMTILTNFPLPLSIHWVYLEGT